MQAVSDGSAWPRRPVKTRTDKWVWYEMTSGTFSIRAYRMVGSTKTPGVATWIRSGLNSLSLLSALKPISSVSCTDG
eukprot:scaffold51231_cov30-Tisochrysis_lutea.AAC.1